jgi:D-arabinan exo alpha-(1,3)/(1,5)-arabinofuranosidase (non-reducing end)
MTGDWPGAMQSHLLAHACPRTRQVSPENPTGQRNEGARAVPDPGDPDLPHSAMAARLGRGFKVRPFISLAAGERRTIAALEGAGVITGLYLTSNLPDLRDLRLRIWWDGDAAAAVDVTVASFFCLGGRSQSHSVTSAMINVGPVRGCSSAWAMPYQQGARLELENTGRVRAGVIAYKVTYEEHDPPAVPGFRFRAATRTGVPDPGTAEFTLLEAPGAGMITGTSLSWLAVAPRWWGEGEVKVYLGDDPFPTLVDTGTEDYFGGAWGFGRDTTFLPGGPVGERAYCGPYAGAPYIEVNEGYEREIALYRWHVNDPIGFEEGVRMSVQALGIGPDGRYEVRADRLTATSYWYQDVAA